MYKQPELLSTVPDERWSWVTPGVAKVDDERKVTVVNGDTGNVNDARNALLDICQYLTTNTVPKY